MQGLDRTSPIRLITTAPDGGNISFCDGHVEFSFWTPGIEVNHPASILYDADP